jgi:hypothetical protein
MNGLEHNYIDSDQVHTCRSFNFLHDYTTARNDRYDAADPRDQSILDQEKHRLSKAWGKAYREKLGETASDSDFGPN